MSNNVEHLLGMLHIFRCHDGYGGAKRLDVLVTVCVVWVVKVVVEVAVVSFLACTGCTTNHHDVTTSNMINMYNSSKLVQSEQNLKKTHHTWLQFGAPRVLTFHLFKLFSQKTSHILAQIDAEPCVRFIGIVCLVEGLVLIRHGCSTARSRGGTFSQARKNPLGACSPRTQRPSRPSKAYCSNSCTFIYSHLPNIHT